MSNTTGTSGIIRTIGSPGTSSHPAVVPTGVTGVQSRFSDPGTRNARLKALRSRTTVREPPTSFATVRVAHTAAGVSDALCPVLRGGDAPHTLHENAFWRPVLG